MCDDVTMASEMRIFRVYIHQCVLGIKVGKGCGEGAGLEWGMRGVSGDDVTWVITSSGPLKCEYFAYKYIKVYGGSRCEGLRRGRG